MAIYHNLYNSCILISKIKLGSCIYKYQAKYKFLYFAHFVQSWESDSIFVPTIFDAKKYVSRFFFCCPHFIAFCTMDHLTQYGSYTKICKKKKVIFLPDRPSPRPLAITGGNMQLVFGCRPHFIALCTMDHLINFGS